MKSITEKGFSYIKMLGINKLVELNSNYHSRNVTYKSGHLSLELSVSHALQNDTQKVFVLTDAILNLH